MGRLINADDLFQCETCFHHRGGGCRGVWCDSGEGYRPDMSRIKTVDAVPVVHGHWISKRDVIGTKYECSECGHSDSKTTAIRGHYCWYCGAKMDEGL